MTAIVQQYIQYIAWPDTQPHAKEVANRDISKVVMPDKYTYAFIFFELVKETVEINGEQVELTSSRRKESPLYYYDAKVYTPAQYAKERPVANWKTVLAYVKKNGWKRFVILRTGEPLPYNGEKIVIPSPK